MTNAKVMLEALGEPMRMGLLERLIEQPATATDLAQALPVTRSAVSQHLQILKAAGLVTDTPVGVRRVYAVDPDALALLRSYFDMFWTRSLDAFRRAAETSHPEPDPLPRPINSMKRMHEQPGQPDIGEHYR